MLNGIPIVPNIVQHEYILTDDHKPHLRSALEGLIGSIRAHAQRNPDSPFEFQWPTGVLLAYSTTGDIYEDAPTYRVTPGLSFRILENLTEELLSIPNELDNIRSVTWNGEQLLRSNSITVSHINIVKSVVPRIIDLSNPGSISPLHEWDHVRIGGAIELVAWLRRYLWGRLFIRRAHGPMYGIAHMHVERSRFVMSHQWFEGEQQIIYTFESSLHIHRVLDPSSEDPVEGLHLEMGPIEFLFSRLKGIFRVVTSMIALLAIMLTWNFPRKSSSTPRRIPEARKVGGERRRSKKKKRKNVKWPKNKKK